MFTKIVILILLVTSVWFGFRYLERRQRLSDGKRKPGERSFGERLRKSVREKTHTGSDTEVVEDTEKCPSCGAFVSVDGISNCGKAKCPY